MKSSEPSSAAAGMRISACDTRTAQRGCGLAGAPGGLRGAARPSGALIDRSM